MGGSNSVVDALKEDTNWIPDNVRSGCFHCERSFDITVRRHHCRCCGEIFCNTCWGLKLKLPIDTFFPQTAAKLDHLRRRKTSESEYEKGKKFVEDPQPVCKVCHSIVQGAAKIFSDNPSVKLRLRRVGLKPRESELGGSSRDAIEATKKIAAQALEKMGQQLEDSSNGIPQSPTQKHGLEDRGCVKWSNPIPTPQDEYNLSLGQWMPFTKGTHLRFQNQGYAPPGGGSWTSSRSASRRAGRGHESLPGSGAVSASVSTRTLPNFSDLPRPHSDDSIEDADGDRSTSPQPATAAAAAAAGGGHCAEGSLLSAGAPSNGLPPIAPVTGANGDAGENGTTPENGGGVPESKVGRRRVVTVTPPPAAGAAHSDPMKPHNPLPPSIGARTNSKTSVDDLARYEEDNAYHGQVVLVNTVSPVPEASKPPSALKNSRAKNRDRRDLVVTPRASVIGSSMKSTENSPSKNGSDGGDHSSNSKQQSSSAPADGPMGSWDAELPPSWRIGCRSIVSVEMTTMFKEFEKNNQLLKIETATQVLLFELVVSKEGGSLLKALKELKAVSLIRARTHISIGDSSRSL